VQVWWKKAEDYPWSSASAHCGLKDDDILGKKEDWGSMFVSLDDWSSWLTVEEDIERLDTLRKHVEKGIPCGSKSFVKALGDKIGRVLELRSQGRPRKENKKGTK